jgi:hypothetical protein
MVLGTLGMVFFDFGSPTPEERELMVTGLIIEVAACVIALFYSIFGLKKVNNTEIDIEELKNEIKQSLLPTQRISSNSDNDKSETLEFGDHVTRNNDLFIDEDFYSAVDAFQVEPPFDTEIYKLKPLPYEIDKEITSAKPFEKHFRESSYQGMKIQWKVRFNTIYENDNSYSVRVKTGARFLRAGFEIDKSIGSRFRTEQEGSIFWLCGKISKVDINGISLEDSQVDFGD